MKKTVDARGKMCPEPLVMTRNAIRVADEGDTIEVLIDNSTSQCNVQAFLNELGMSNTTEQHGDEFTITFTVQNTPNTKNVQDIQPIEFCTTPLAPRKSGYAVVLKSQTMGVGDDQLGSLLVRACLNSLNELDEKPTVVILYNAGVKLALQGTDTAAALEKLAHAGIDIILCGTCVDYFDIKDKISIGKVSNMFRINELLAAASHVVYP